MLVERDALGAEAFEIVVKGRLTPTLVGALDGFEVLRCSGGLTYLVGWVPDQARLHGLLATLWDLNIQIKSVNAIEPADAPLPPDDLAPGGMGGSGGMGG